MATLSKSAAALMLLMLLLTACNLPRPAQTPTLAADPVGTAAAQTVAALSTQLAPPASPTPADTPQPALPSPSPTQGLPVTAAASPTSLACDRAEFVSDVTVPDGTAFGTGQSFVKTWRLKNTGSCTWTTSYRVVFDSGNALGAPASFNLPTNVPPDGIVDISVNMRAPETAREYESFWKLQNASGMTFGLGSNADKAFWVKITVGSTPAPFAVTRVVTRADNADFSGACPHTFKLSADITSAAAGRVTYFWELSDGQKSAAQEVVFDKNDTKTVTYDWPLNASFDGWVKVYIDNPNHQYFQQLNLKLTCSP